MTTGSYLLSVYFSRGTAAKWKGTPMPTPRFPSTTLIATALAMTFLAASAHAHGGQHSHARLMVSGSAAPASIAQGSQRSTSKPITNPTTPAVPSSLATTITIAPITVGPPVLPPSAIGTPMERALDIAPLSPQLPTQVATGGAATTSAQGGGGKTLKDCLGFWDAATHMSKVEWKVACLRTMDRIANP